MKFFGIIASKQQLHTRKVWTKGGHFREVILNSSS